MKDYLVRVITRNGNVRGLACVTTKLVDKACRLHGTYPTAAAALGRALTGGVLMGALLKSRQRVALRFEGNGPLKKILAEADSTGAVRGYVGNPLVDLPLKNGKFDVAGAIGRAGFLTVTKDLGVKEPYQGIVQLYTSEIGEDLAYYFVESEQIPSAVGVGVYAEPDSGITAAGGFLIQSLPPSDDAVIDRLVSQIQTLPPVTEMIRDGRTPEEMLEMMFAGVPIDILEKREVAFHCTCSRERMERALISLGADEIRAIIEEQGEAEVNCEFCRENYTFNREALTALAEKAVRPAP
ncbi:Hsp33 family molecular chaperone HslO [Desulfonema ishimotonii]|uniref:33 kDa chaperonin n=1 Tax=Desulfonema ishimotonii TaxID=45657 RepID=A0A401G217_9BACT|nr:Hsp33 family molecular chaperone HslO [Desulfonema ishimotonii]GBC63260.1 Hsp33 family molecular chaperone HslO [Desulfonema ishimotonii]